MGRLHDDIIKRASRVTGQSEEEIKEKVTTSKPKTNTTVVPPFNRGTGTTGGSSGGTTTTATKATTEDTTTKTVTEGYDTAAPGSLQRMIDVGSARRETGYTPPADKPFSETEKQYIIKGAPGVKPVSDITTARELQGMGTVGHAAGIATVRKRTSELEQAKEEHIKSYEEQKDLISKYESQLKPGYQYKFEDDPKLYSYDETKRKYATIRDMLEKDYTSGIKNIEQGIVDLKGYRSALKERTVKGIIEGKPVSYTSGLYAISPESIMLKGQNGYTAIGATKPYKGAYIKVTPEGTRWSTPEEAFKSIYPAKETSLPVEVLTTAIPVLRPFLTSSPEQTFGYKQMMSLGIPATLNIGRWEKYKQEEYARMLELTPRSGEGKLAYTARFWSSPEAIESTWLPIATMGAGYLTKGLSVGGQVIGKGLLAGKVSGFGATTAGKVTLFGSKAALGSTAAIGITSAGIGLGMTAAQNPEQLGTVGGHLLSGSVLAGGGFVLGRSAYKMPELKMIKGKYDVSTRALWERIQTKDTVKPPEQYGKIKGYVEATFHGKEPGTGIKYFWRMEGIGKGGKPIGEFMQVSRSSGVFRDVTSGKIQSAYESYGKSTTPIGMKTGGKPGTLVDISKPTGREITLSAYEFAKYLEVRGELSSISKIPLKGDVAGLYYRGDRNIMIDIKSPKTKLGSLLKYKSLYLTEKTVLTHEIVHFLQEKYNIPRFSKITGKYLSEHQAYWLEKNIAKFVVEGDKFGYITKQGMKTMISTRTPMDVSISSESFVTGVYGKTPDVFTGKGISMIKQIGSKTKPIRVGNVGKSDITAMGEFRTSLKVGMGTFESYHTTGKYFEIGEANLLTGFKKAGGSIKPSETTGVGRYARGTGKLARLVTETLPMQESITGGMVSRSVSKGIGKTGFVMNQILVPKVIPIAKTGQISKLNYIYLPKQGQTLKMVKTIQPIQIPKIIQTVTTGSKTNQIQIPKIMQVPKTLLVELQKQIQLPKTKNIFSSKQTQVVAPSPVTIGGFSVVSPISIPFVMPDLPLYGRGRKGYGADYYKKKYRFRGFKIKSPLKGIKL